MTTTSLEEAQTQAAITTHGIARSYNPGPFGKTTHALHPVSLAVPHGSIFALLGHNGAGKTTLIKLLVNILRPSSGHGTTLGRPSTSIAGNDFTRIGYVSENQDLPGWMTVRAFLKYQSGFYPVWNDAALIQRFDLPMGRKLKHLSRGQLMKVALASVLAFSPSLIILDEPFSGLDPLVRDELIEALLDSAAEKLAAGAEPLTVLLSSHDLAEIESFATHVAFLHAGHLLFTEEMPQLSARFRDVTVTLPATLPASQTTPPPPLPTTWLQTQHTAHTLHFIHTQAHNESIEDQVRTHFPLATAIDIEPMTLRSIFLAVTSANQGSRA